MRKGTYSRLADPASRATRAPTRKRVRAAAATMMAVNRSSFVSRLGRGINSASVFQPPRGKELKFVDVSSTQSPAIAGTGTLSAALVQLPQDATASGRVGTEDTVRSLEWRQAISLATTTGSGAIRTAIIYDKAPNGLAPTITGVPNGIFNVDSINAQMNLINRDRFTVIQDIITTCVGSVGPGADYQKGYRKLSLPQVWNAGGAGGIATLNTGNFVAVTWASPGFAVAPPTVTLQTRFRYEDA